MRARLVLVLLGAWIALAVGSAVVATANFRTVDRILAPGYRPELAERLAPRTAAEERPLFRYLASELNRRYFRGFAWTQLALAALLLVLVLGDPGAGVGGRLLAAATAALTALSGLWLTPAILRRGPPLDFVPRPFPPAWQEAAAAFFRLHATYLVVDLARLVLLVALLVVFLARREPSGYGDRGPGARSPRPARR